MNSPEAPQVPPTPARRPWSPPTLQRLDLALDTANTVGSNIDGFSGTIF